MGNFKDALIRLLSMKRIIALIITLVYSYLVITRKEVDPNFLAIFSSIIAFYFGQSTTRDAIQEYKGTGPGSGPGSNNNSTH